MLGKGPIENSTDPHLFVEPLMNTRTAVVGSWRLFEIFFYGYRVPLKLLAEKFYMTVVMLEKPFLAGFSNSSSSQTNEDFFLR